MNEIEKIAHLISKNKIGIFPCDTILGIVGLANEKVAERIIQLKQRSSNKGFIHLIKDYQQLHSLIKEPLNEDQQKVCKQYWPGTYSFIFDKHPKIPSIQSGNSKSIAIRMPQFKALNSLLDKVGAPLLSTSVNLANQAHSNTKESVSNDILELIQFFYETIKAPKNSASTVVDIRQKPFTVLRQGQALFKFL